ncbi:helix-turn-helix transcriptional regulator [Streptomyces sp. NPDC020883]|uniref:helix-turn-helix transcriptional regulator n=1 Tax=Streptomyces sp. NPDC020883 TaxID=3365099 RepID=UPI00379F83B5
METYLTTAEVAERYRTSESTVRYWRQIGKGPRGVKIGKRVLYSTAELLRYEQALAQGSGEWGMAV